MKKWITLLVLISTIECFGAFGIPFKELRNLEGTYKAEGIKLVFGYGPAFFANHYEQLTNDLFNLGRVNPKGIGARINDRAQFVALAQEMHAFGYSRSDILYSLTRVALLYDHYWISRRYPAELTKYLQEARQVIEENNLQSELIRALLMDAPFLRSRTKRVLIENELGGFINDDSSVLIALMALKIENGSLYAKYFPSVEGIVLAPVFFRVNSRGNEFRAVINQEINKLQGQTRPSKYQGVFSE